MEQKQQSEQEINKDQPQTIRDPQDGELKTTIPNPHEVPAEETIKKEEVNNA